MIPIKTYRIEDSNLRYCLARIGDLINMDGPMLSLFKDTRNNDLYLFDWADSDEQINRWLVYKVDAKTVSRFIKRKMSFRQMFHSTDSYYVTDIKNGENPPFEISKLEKLPIEYAPNDDSFFDQSDAKNIDKIKSVLDDLLNKTKGGIFASAENLNIADYNKSKFHSIYILSPNNIGIEAFIEATETNENDVRHSFHPSRLAQQNDNKPNRFPEKARVGLLIR